MDNRPAVLLVDDNGDDRELMEILLRERLAGARVLAAADPVALGELLSGERFQAAVIEADLGWCQPAVLVEKLRTGSRDCVVVFYSGGGIGALTPAIADLCLTGYYRKEPAHLLEISRILAGRLDVTPLKTGNNTAGGVGDDVADAATDAVSDAAFQSEMFHAISHDLRQPLQVFNRQVKLLDRKYKNKLDNDGRGLIENMSQVASQMDMLLESILSYYRLDVLDGEDEDVVPVRDIVNAVVATFKAELDEIGGAVAVGSLCDIKLERGRLSRLFQNLIHNAIKFRSADPLRIQINALDVTDHWLFTVEDNGIGLEQEEADRIFVMFKRLHSRERYPGSGVGLALCKRIVDQLGGRIWARSKPGEGTAIHFTLPKQGPMSREKLRESKQPDHEKSDKGAAGRG